MKAVLIKNLGRILQYDKWRNLLKKGNFKIEFEKTRRKLH